MKRNKTIDQIIESGSVRQKIKLYMTDIALLNVNPNSLELTDNGDIKGTTLLTAQERDYLYQCIRTPKDVEYYENMRRINSVFLFFKESASTQVMLLSSLYLLISKPKKEMDRVMDGLEVINELLDLYPNEKTRAKALKVALRMTKNSGGQLYQANPKYVDLNRETYFKEIADIVLNATRVAIHCKEFILMFKEILSKDLPLKPYKDWVKSMEKRVKKIVEAIYDITTADENYPDDIPKFPKYEDIEAIITEEDIQDFKTSQL